MSGSEMVSNWQLLGYGGRMRNWESFIEDEEINLAPPT